MQMPRNLILANNSQQEKHDHYIGKNIYGQQKKISMPSKHSDVQRNIEKKHNDVKLDRSWISKRASSHKCSNIYQI